MGNEMQGYRETKGRQGEAYLFGAFNQTGVPYLPIDNRKETMPRYLSRAGGKRPDVVVPGDDYKDAIFVDMKHKRLNTDGKRPYFTVDKKEISQYMATQKQMRKKIVLIYKDNSRDSKEMYAIPVDQVATGRYERVNGRDGPFYKVDLKEFKKIRPDAIASDVLKSSPR